MVTVQKLLNINKPLKIKLHFFQNKKYNKSMINEFEKKCKDNGIKVSRAYAYSSLIIYKMDSCTLEQLNILKHLYGVEHISNMPIISMD